MYAITSGNIGAFKSKEMKALLKKNKISFDVVSTISLYQLFEGDDRSICIGSTWNKDKDEFSYQVAAGTRNSGLFVYSTNGNVPSTLREQFNNYYGRGWDGEYDTVTSKYELYKLLRDVLEIHTEETSSHLSYNLIVTTKEEVSKSIYSDEYIAKPVSALLLPYPAPDEANGVITEIVNSQTPFIVNLLSSRDTKTDISGGVLKLNLTKKPTIVSYIGEVKIDGFKVVTDESKDYIGILFDSRDLMSLVEILESAINDDVNIYFLWDGSKLTSYSLSEITELFTPLIEAIGNPRRRKFSRGHHQQPRQYPPA